MNIMISMKPDRTLLVIPGLVIKVAADSPVAAEMMQPEICEAFPGKEICVEAREFYRGQ